MPSEFPLSGRLQRASEPQDLELDADLEAPNGVPTERILNSRRDRGMLEIASEILPSRDKGYSYP